MSSRALIPCPHLPDPEPIMSHRCLTDLEKNTPEFYLKALQYGHYLWRQGHAGRAILALTRSLYAHLEPNDPILQTCPLPYAGLKWIVAHHASDDFPGNPRISFQHQATRLRGERQELRRARAWAAWALICEARPHLPGDLADPTKEPTLQQISDLLEAHGHPGEPTLWRSALSASF